MAEEAPETTKKASSFPTAWVKEHWLPIVLVAVLFAGVGYMVKQNS